MINKTRPIFTCLIVIIFTQLITANPIAPCGQGANPISEIQIIDPMHWSIEINGAISFGRILDSIYIGVYKASSTSVLPDTYLTPINKILFDSTSEIAVVTETNFPSLKFFKNSKTIVRTVNFSSTGTINSVCNWGINVGPMAINIDSTLHPNQSIVRVPTLYWYNDNLGMGQPDMQLRGSCTYAKCDSPTIGKINNLKEILNVVTGRIKDPKNNLLRGITLNSTPNLGGNFLNPSDGVFLSPTHTDSAGRFSVKQIASFPSTFTFADSIDSNTISRKILGPFYGEPDSTIDVGDFVLDDYIPTGVVNKHFEQTKNASSSLNILGVFSALNQKGVKIVIANNTNASSPITISILTVKGQKIHDISGVISGTGTTTINWDGKNAFGKKVPAGTYVVNLFSNKNQIQRAYAVIQ